MARTIAHDSDIDNCGLSYSELQELWLGAHPTSGSLFRSREELVAAWAQGRAVVMRLWGSHGRRPMAWWNFEAGDLEHPGYFRERSTLWRAGVLSQQERSELEAEWRREYDAARGKGVRERREAYEHHDVPDELITAWTAARRRPNRQPAPLEEAAATK
jgi:hypothetical protein